MINFGGAHADLCLFHTRAKCVDKKHRLLSNTPRKFVSLFYASYCEGEFSSREIGILLLHSFFLHSNSFGIIFLLRKEKTRSSKVCTLWPATCSLKKVHSISNLGIAPPYTLRERSSLINGCLFTPIDFTILNMTQIPSLIILL